MKTIVILILVTLSQYSYGIDRNPLIGKWVLDKDRTISYAKESGSLTEENKNIWTESKTILEFTQNNYVINYGGDVVSGSYKIVKATDKYVIIVYNNTSTMETVYIVNRGIYLVEDEDSNVRVYFSKIK